MQYVTVLLGTVVNSVTEHTQGHTHMHNITLLEFPAIGKAQKDTETER